MGKLWVASLIAILSTIPAVFAEGAWSPFVRFLQIASPLALPGLMLAQVLSQIGSNYPNVVNSHGFVFLVSAFGNTLFYWAVLSLFAGLLTLVNRPSSRHAR